MPPKTQKINQNQFNTTIGSIIGNHDFSKTFLNQLEEEYPDKFLILLEFKFNLDSLNNYVDQYKLTPEVFEPLKFKEYITIINRIFE